MTHNGEILNIYFDSSGGHYEYVGKEFSLTPDQRYTIRERDEDHCQGCGIWVHCDRKEPERNTERLQVHHISPRGYSLRLNINPNYSENLITLCTKMHVGHIDSIHPDTYQAKMTYAGEQDSYHKMNIARREKLDNREIYWNPAYDRPMSMIAVRNTQKAIVEGGELAEKLRDLFPVVRVK